MADAIDVDTTTRAYTLKLSGSENWRELLWTTHVTVNRSAQVWGDWLLSLRGGLPASLAESQTERRVLLALSWLSVESPASLVPDKHIVARGTDVSDVRRRAVMERFEAVLARLNVENSHEWIVACEPALTARIRDDAVWVDRSACFGEMQLRYIGLDANWAANTLFDLLGGVDVYFALPDDGDADTAEAKDFVKKARRWLSRNWGSGEKSDSLAIATNLSRLAELEESQIVGKSARDALAVLLGVLGGLADPKQDSAELFEQVKQAVGWRTGRWSTGAIALGKIRDVVNVTGDLWQLSAAKFREESTTKGATGAAPKEPVDWMRKLRADMDRAFGMPFRSLSISRHNQRSYTETGRGIGTPRQSEIDLTTELSVTLDHALRRVSASHTWIKRAEVERRRFQDDAAKIEAVPDAAREWLDRFCEVRSSASGAQDEYLIRKRAIDGWDKVVEAWGALGKDATRMQRILAARDVQANLDDSDKFGDIQLFAGFGDVDAEEPQVCLADESAECVWRNQEGKPTVEILKNYVDASVANHDQTRFKVPAYRHPDPLRHPIYVDFGDSRWDICFDALDAAKQQAKAVKHSQVVDVKGERNRREKQDVKSVDLRGVVLGVWSGEALLRLSLRWHSKRLWRDLAIEKQPNVEAAETVSRADRLGRLAAGSSTASNINVAEVFEQKDWSGRLQVPREQLDHLADLVYGKVGGKRAEPAFSLLDSIKSNPRARKVWENLTWFLTTSAKLKPNGPWLDFVNAGLPNGVEYKRSRSGYFLSHAANQGRKSQQSRLKLARIPGLRVLSLDLGHRYAAACAVWEAVTQEQLIQDCHDAGMSPPSGEDLYVHVRRPTGRLQRSGSKKGQPVTSTTIYRRIGADMLPDGSQHPAPWARLERQFLIKLQGEERPTRMARQDESDAVSDFRSFLGVTPLTERSHIDELQRDAVRLARLGLRRLSDAARIAFAMTATKKPVLGGRNDELTSEQRVEYVQDALALWQGMAGSRHFVDSWAKRAWQSWIIDKLGGPLPVEIPDDLRRSERSKRLEASREPLKVVAEKLADPRADDAVELNRLWTEEYELRVTEWRRYLRWLRTFILPRKKQFQSQGRKIYGVGGLSVRRLQTIRDLYQVLKAFRMRPEPVDLRKNVPSAGDESLANFGRRILTQLERLREQRIKQLGSRVVEAALGAGRMSRSLGRDRKRPQERRDRPCHVVVVENLERYRPEDSRLRRENRQLMDWSARNVRKYIVEGCQLHGLHFEEVSPNYTSRQDSRTGAPGIRCEEVSVRVLKEAARRADALATSQFDDAGNSSGTRFERDVRWWSRELTRLRGTKGEPSERDRVFLEIMANMAQIPDARPTIRLPRRGGELFVSAGDSSRVFSLQADLNAAANIGLRALMDPDWIGAWWYVLVSLATGTPAKEKVAGCAAWESHEPIWSPAVASEGTAPSKKSGRANRPKSEVNAWNPMFSSFFAPSGWLNTKTYWEQVESEIARRLRISQVEPENPF